MADLGIFRVDSSPLISRRERPWLMQILSHLPHQFKAKVTGFGQAIKPLTRGDEAEACAMYAGQFTAAGQTISATAPFVFDPDQGTIKWQQAMHDLSWLKHFAASKRQLHAHYALRLLGRWAKAPHPHKDLVTNSQILIALATHGAQLAIGSVENLQSEFLKIATAQTNAVAACKTVTSDEAVLKAVTLLLASTAFRGFENVKKSATELLERNIDKIIMSDGGHSSGKPQAILELLTLLVPLRDAFEQDRQFLPSHAAHAFERMLSFLAMLRHGDGSLAFIDKATDYKNFAREILSQNAARAAPTLFAPHTQLARLAKGKTCLIAATHSNYEFEFSDGPHFVFDCSSSRTAHNTATAKATEAKAGAMLQLHDRTYFLAANGEDLRVEDIYETNLEIAFKLHASVKLTALRESTDLLLVLPDRAVWKLSIRGAEARIEQNGLILRLLSTGSGRINWALKKQAKAVKSVARKAPHEPDL